MANLLHAADKAGHSKSLNGHGKDEQDDLVKKLKDEVVGKFAQDLGKLSGEIESMRRQTLQEEE